MSGEDWQMCMARLVSLITHGNDDGDLEGGSWVPNTLAVHPYTHGLEKLFTLILYGVELSICSYYEMQISFFFFHCTLLEGLWCKQVALWKAGNTVIYFKCCEISLDYS